MLARSADLVYENKIRFCAAQVHENVRETGVWKGAWQGAWKGAWKLYEKNPRIFQSNVVGFNTGKNPYRIHAESIHTENSLKNRIHTPFHSKNKSKIDKERSRIHTGFTARDSSREIKFAAVFKVCLDKATAAAPAFARHRAYWGNNHNNNVSGGRSCRAKSFSY